MIRNLTIITIAGLVLALVGIGGAFALGGNDLARHNWTWVVDETNGALNMRRSTGDAPEPTDVIKTLAWEPSDRLVLDLPVDVTFIQGDQAGVVLTGPQSAIDRVRVNNGRIVMDDDEGAERGYVRWSRNGIRAWSDEDRLKVVVTAPSVTSFDIIGSSDVSIRNYDQPALTLNISGSGDVEIEGATRTFTADITGSGDTDADRLDITDAQVDISGSGEMRMGPTGEVRIDLSGSGDVDLTRRPARLQQQISGSGGIEES